MKGTINISSDTPEQELIESLLNYKCSCGVYPVLVLPFHALVHAWGIEKLSYYVNMLEDVK